MSDDFDTIPVPGTEGTDGTDGTGADAPPFAPPDRERTRDMRKLEQQLADLYASVGVYGGMLAGKRGILAGTIVSANAGTLADAWVDLAERDARVKRALVNLVQSGGWAGVIGAHVAMVLPILAIYGALPDTMTGLIWTGVEAQNPDLFAALRAQAASMGMGPQQNGNGAGDHG